MPALMALRPGIVVVGAPTPELALAKLVPSLFGTTGGYIGNAECAATANGNIRRHFLGAEEQRKAVEAPPPLSSSGSAPPQPKSLGLACVLSDHPVGS